MDQDDLGSSFRGKTNDRFLIIEIDFFLFKHTCIL